MNKEIDKLSQQINNYRSEIEEAKKQERTLKNELGIIQREIKKISLEIRESDLMIQGLEAEIEELKDKISKIDQRIGEQRTLLASAIRALYEKDRKSLLEIILDQPRFSDFFDEIEALKNLEVSLKEHLDNVKLLRVDLGKELETFDDKKDEFMKVKSLQLFQKSSLRNKEDENSRILKETKGKENLFQDLIKQKQKDLQTIRQRLYLLGGSGVSMSLEEALKQVEFVSKLTGVRPAFLLGLLKVESEWGGNTGKGYWKKDMYDCYIKLGKISVAEKQKSAFMQITSELGLNPDTVFVSAEPRYGCGGAMGPAQFMPTTWLAYKNEVAAVTGHNPPSPWSIDDAFTAAAIKLVNAGAAQQTSVSEWKAAMIYFAGNNWNKPAYRFYGDSVMEFAEAIQKEIDLIKSGR